MSGTTPTIVTPDTDSINVDKLLAELNAINDGVISLLEQGNAVLANAAASITPEALADGRLITYKPAAPPHFNGSEMIPAQPEHWELADEAYYARLQQRLTVLKSLVKVFNDPIPNLTYSYADLIRAGGKRWSAI